MNKDYIEEMLKNLRESTKKENPSQEEALKEQGEALIDKIVVRQLKKLEDLTETYKDYWLQVHHEGPLFEEELQRFEEHLYEQSKIVSFIDYLMNLRLHEQNPTSKH